MFIQGLWDFVLQYVDDTQNDVAAANGWADLLGSRCTWSEQQASCFCATQMPNRSSACIRPSLIPTRHFEL